MKHSVVVPGYMKSTLHMLRAAYPETIGDGELPSLMAVFSDAGMSNRSVAAAIGFYFGKPYVDYLYQAGVSSTDDTVTFITKELVLDQLRLHGYDAWLAALD